MQKAGHVDYKVKIHLQKIRKIPSLKTKTLQSKI